MLHVTTEDFLLADQGHQATKVWGKVGCELTFKIQVSELAVETHAPFERMIRRKLPTVMQTVVNHRQSRPLPLVMQVLLQQHHN